MDNTELMEILAVVIAIVLIIGCIVLFGIVFPMDNSRKDCEEIGGMYKVDSRGSDECWNEDGTKILKFYNI